MSLPRLNHPIYETTLPDSNKKIKYRGFLACEEKILLLAVQSQEPVQMTMALKQILRNCIIDKIDVEKLPMYSVEWVYLQIVSKSLGEELNLSVTCASCQEEVSYTLSLTDIQSPVVKKRANVIKLDDDIYIQLNYPVLDTLDDLDIINESKEIQSAEAIFGAITRNVECIISGDETFHLKDSEEAEILEWFDGLSGKQLTMITDFFANIPTIEEKIEFTCKCGHHNLYGIRGISELFL